MRSASFRRFRLPRSPLRPEADPLAEQAVYFEAVYNSPMAEPYRLTDSPWFWALLFSLMALAGLGLIAPKFDVRQRQIEGRFLGRQQAAEERARRAAGLAPVDLAEQARDREDVAPKRIVPLWTLATLAALSAAGSGWMLRREILAVRK
jgi:alpha-beta hydrolase superfamily lysophospholipase